MFPTHVGIARQTSTACGLAPHVPYACGDCACSASRRQTVNPCSLRMWGLRGRVRRQPPDVRMFPTHVGIARIEQFARMTTRNVPYACGDCALTSHRASRVSKCSLRMWGLRDRVRAGQQFRNMFPTHVGIARASSAARSASRNVPYACGDCAYLPTGLHPETQCSLRMWGLRGRVRRQPPDVRMFPTHVGIARAAGYLQEPASDVPYACGDCAGKHVLNDVRVVCSLRMWGLRGVGGTRQTGGMMFPTHVGIARTYWMTSASSSDVPYACGDCASTQYMQRYCS